MVWAQWMLPEPRAQILVVDDEANLRRVLCAQLQREGYDVHAAADGYEALQILANHHVDVVVTDLRMPGIDGMVLLREAQKIDVDLPVIMITAHGSVDNAVEALKSGAFDYLTKPFDQTDVQVVVRKAVQTRRFSERETHRTSIVSVWDGSTVVGTSPAATRLKHALEQAAQRESHVLVVGERGTGKELLARALHRVSPNQTAPFIKAHCEATSAEYIAAELFGWEAPDQTSPPKPGKVELAAGGCLLLEEVSQTEPALQRRLAMLMSRGIFEREGGVHHIEAAVRVLASLRGLPNEPVILPELRAQFETTLHVPPLRERLEDIPALCRHFVARYSQRLSKAIDRVDDEVFDVLSRYTWPGNLRELENVIEHAVLFCDEGRLGVANLPQLTGESGSLTPPAVTSALPDDGVEGAKGVHTGLKERVKEATSKLERDLIHRALHQTGGNVTHAARLLKISRKGLQLKMKELGLRERDERGH